MQSSSLAKVSTHCLHNDLYLHKEEGLLTTTIADRFTVSRATGCARQAPSTLLYTQSRGSQTTYPLSSMSLDWAIPLRAGFTVVTGCTKPDTHCSANTLPHSGVLKMLLKVLQYVKHYTTSPNGGPGLQFMIWLVALSMWNKTTCCVATHLVKVLEANRPCELDLARLVEVHHHTGLGCAGLIVDDLL